MKYVRWNGPDVTLVTGHFTGPVETGDIRMVEDDRVQELVLEEPIDAGEGAAQRPGGWSLLSDEEAKAYEAQSKKQAKAMKTGIAKPEVVKTEEVQSQGQQ